MEITLRSTSKIVTVNGNVQARVWEGATASGTPITALVTRIVVAEDAGAERHAEFERELQETAAPTGVNEAFPLRLIL